MANLTITLRVLTPLFMGGVDPQKSELRAASIRGAMRFWFRAMAGAVTDDPKQVYKLESEVFGSTEKKSKVVVRVIKDKNNYDELEVGYSISPEVAYLANMGLARPGKGFIRKAIAPSSEFWIEIFETGPVIDIGIFVFKIATSLGGFGARWRHGFGSCAIVQENGGDPSTIDIFDLIYSTIQKVKKLAKKLGISESKSGNLPEFPSFVDPYFQIWEKKSNPENWNRILSEIGKKYREFRIEDEDNNHYGHTWEFLKIVKPLFENKKVETNDPRNDIFGLPIQIQISKKYGAKRKTALINAENKDIGRRASPLILHVEPNKSLIRATLFISKFLPQSVPYNVKYRNTRLELQKPSSEDFSRIEEFMSYLGLTRRYSNVR